ncbi:MAG: IS66 family transposase [Lachnospiraceae bacterium]|nr:IS66 family transposase [Lachnospiraceae bacterium]
MKADRDAFIARIKQLDRDILVGLTISFYDELEQLRTSQLENERINTEAYIQFSELDKKYASLVRENEDLKKLLAKEIEKNALKTKTIFGRKTEGFPALLDALDNPEEEPVDENTIEDIGPVMERKCRVIDFESHKDKQSVKDRHPKKSPSLSASLEKLPQQIIYDLDVDGMDMQYGEGNWRIAHWHQHKQLMKLDTPYYTQVVYTPVVSVGLEHDLFTIPYMNPLIDRSAVSYTIIADILYRKFTLGLPFYRQALDYQMQGITLIKQTIINWINTLVPKICEEVYEFMTLLLVGYKYAQCDETYIQVNKDGYGPGHKSYLWVHTSSELSDCPPIIIFCYEETRGTDHLRRFFREFLGYITCDAYISYRVLEEESGGDILTTGCFMHCRRYFAEAFFVQNVAAMSDDELTALPETKALLLIRAIYQEENKLKEMTADERLSARKANVALKVDAFFGYVHALEGSDEVFSDRMKKAITYAINQEQNLRRFLTDGNIPCDNGYVERIIRSYSVGRANWLFADTIHGAKVNAIMYSIVETAKANHANVLIYLQYLFEQIPLRREGDDKDFMSDMMPWSEAYRTYEDKKQLQRQSLYGQLFPEPERPRAPRKRDRSVGMPQGDGLTA